MKKVIRRLTDPTPKFFKVFRNVGLVLATIGGTLVTAPVSLPIIVTTIGGYVAVAGGVISAVSQLTTIDKENNVIK
jgi:uncharacterized membrane protein HdeD (DUF308 family)